MSANYEWQKMQSNQQIQARLNEAEVQRAVKRNRKNSGFFLFRLVGRLFSAPKAENLQTDSAENTRHSRREEKAGYV